MLTQHNAPARGEGVIVQLAGQNTTTSNEKAIQMQVLSSRLGLSGPMADLILSLLRGEPYRHG